MNYNLVRDWVRNKYPEILLIDSGDMEKDSVIEIQNGEGSVKITRNKIDSEGHGSIIKNTKNVPFLYEDKKYNAVIVITYYEDLRKNILALLHELGHYTEDQSGNVLYNEIKAWEGCEKHLRKLGLSLEWKNFARECLGTYEREYPSFINKRYNILKRNSGLITKEYFDKLYATKNTPLCLYGKECWRKPWKNGRMS